MSTGKKKLGRPLLNEPEREELRLVGFKADRATLAAIEELEARVEPSIETGRRSVAIRRALLAAAKNASSK